MTARASAAAVAIAILLSAGTADAKTQQRGGSREPPRVDYVVRDRGSGLYYLYRSDGQTQLAIPENYRGPRPSQADPEE